jgi:hypothetical protein
MPAVLIGTTDLRFEPRRGEGPVGTGVHLLRRTRDSTGVTIADVWLTFLFLPVVPFGEWTVERGGASGSSWLVTRIERPRVMRSVAWVAGGIVAGLVSLVPAYVAVAFFMGSKPAELGGLFSSAGGIIGTIGWLDQTRERVPFRTAVRALARAARSPAQGAEN